MAMKSRLSASLANTRFHGKENVLVNISRPQKEKENVLTPRLTPAASAAPMYTSGPVGMPHRPRMMMERVHLQVPGRAPTPQRALSQ